MLVTVRYLSFLTRWCAHPGRCKSIATKKKYKKNLLLLKDVGSSFRGCAGTGSKAASKIMLLGTCRASRGFCTGFFWGGMVRKSKILPARYGCLAFLLSLQDVGSSFRACAYTGSKAASKMLLLDTRRASCGFCTGCCASRNSSRPVRLPSIVAVVARRGFFVQRVRLHGKQGRLENVAARHAPRFMQF
jgi:hypothetical protein